MTIRALIGDALECVPSLKSGVVVGLACLGLALVGRPTAAQAQPKAEIRVLEKLDLVEAERKGRALVKDLLAQAPLEAVTNLGQLTIRDSKGATTTLPVRFEIRIRPNGWQSVYAVLPSGTNAGISLVIHQGIGQGNRYELFSPADAREPKRLAGNEAMISFAGSDYWVADFGLEFLHWPKQLLLGRTVRRGQTCNILESQNPNSTPGSYSRVKAWLDEDTGGIVNAEAYDVGGRLLKQFAPKSFEKLQGQWRLQRMEISNRQDGSRSTIEFKDPAGAR